MNAPKLRFKEFNDEWISQKLFQLVEFSKGNILAKADLDETGSYPCILYGQLYTKYNEVIREIYSKTNRNENNIPKSKKGDVLIPSSGETPIDISTSSCIQIDNVLIGGDINILRPISCDGRFLSYLINNNKKTEIAKVAQGHSVVHLYNDNLKQVLINIPSIQEQKRISDTLELLDKKIELQSKKIEDLKLFKLSIKNNIFKSFDKEQKMSIEELLEFEQPTKYIVKSEEYTDNRDDIPVLTANKAFILGYCKESNFYNKECIIFDDFTLDMKYVNFAFKVKSSAIKILTPKENINIKYIYEYMQFLNLHSEEHKRHYISIVQKIQIPVPIFEIQNKIATQLNCFDSKIELENNKLLKLTELKKGLMQNMFV